MYNRMEKVWLQEAEETFNNANEPVTTYTDTKEIVMRIELHRQQWLQGPARAQNFDYIGLTYERDIKPHETRIRRGEDVFNVKEVDNNHRLTRLYLAKHIPKGKAGSSGDVSEE